MFRRNIAVALVLLTAATAQAKERDAWRLAPPAAQPIGQVLYKGVVGNLLETLPIDAQQRVDLQRANAVVSNSLSGRSLGLLLGITNPVLMVGGLIWGIWAATQIKPPTVNTAWLGSWNGKHGLGFCRRSEDKVCQLRSSDSTSSNVPAPHLEPVRAAPEDAPSSTIAQVD